MMSVYETMYEHALNVYLTRFQFVLCCGRNVSTRSAGIWATRLQS